MDTGFEMQIEVVIADNEDGANAVNLAYMLKEELHNGKETRDSLLYYWNVLIFDECLPIREAPYFSLQLCVSEFFFLNTILL